MSETFIWIYCSCNKNIGCGISAKILKDFKFHEIIDDTEDNGDNIGRDGPFSQLQIDVIQDNPKKIMYLWQPKDIIISNQALNMNN